MNPKINLGVTGGGYITATAYDGYTTRTVTSPNPYNTDTPVKAEVNYTTGGSLALLINGVEVAKTTGTPLKTIGSEWIRVADQLESQTYIYSLCVFNNELYGGTSPNGKLFKWNGTNAWVKVADQLESQLVVISMCVFNNELYGGTSPNGKLFKWNGTNAWVKVADQLESQTAIYSLCVFNNELYGGTSPNGKLFKYVSGTGWTKVADQLESQTDIRNLCVFNNELYGGTYPSGKLFKYVPGTGWIRVADQLESQTHIQNLWNFNNILYGGTGPNGKLFKYNGVGTNHTTTIGNNYELTAPFPGSLALTKFSGTVPTAEQSLYMYEQEKQLFNSNTKCILPDTNAIVDLTYDSTTNNWKSASSANLSEWNGLVRTNVLPSTNTISKIVSAQNNTLIANSTGVSIKTNNFDIKRRILEKDAYTKSNIYSDEILDFIGGFTGDLTLDSTSITSTINITYPTKYIGAVISHANLTAGTYITGISGTTIYISSPVITATVVGANIQFKDFILPVGFQTKNVAQNGIYKIEGSTKDYVKTYDGFKETVSFNTPPQYTDWIQIQITKN